MQSERVMSKAGGVGYNKCIDLACSKLMMQETGESSTPVESAGGYIYTWECVTRDMLR
jgi:uncharacterized phosphosugar-binding protein